MSQGGYVEWGTLACNTPQGSSEITAVQRTCAEHGAADRRAAGRRRIDDATSCTVVEDSRSRSVAQSRPLETSPHLGSRRDKRFVICVVYTFIWLPATRAVAGSPLRGLQPLLPAATRPPAIRPLTASSAGPAKFCMTAPLPPYPKASGGGFPNNTTSTPSAPSARAACARGTTKWASCGEVG